MFIAQLLMAGSSFMEADATESHATRPISCNRRHRAIFMRAATALQADKCDISLDAAHRATASLVLRRWSERDSSFERNAWAHNLSDIR